MQRPQIDYAPALPRRRARRVTRQVMIGVVLLMTAIVTMRAGPSAWRRIQILYWQRQAMRYAPPGNRIVYTDDPTEVAKLRSTDPSLIAGSHGEMFEFVRPWDQLYRLVSPPGRQPAATVFLHERTNERGEHRLVIVELGRTSRINYPPFFKPLRVFRCEVFEPGDLWRAPQETVGPSHGGGIIAAGGSVEGTATWFAGLPDPNDPSHFTISGLRDGSPVTLDGWLRGDDVELFSIR